MIDDKNLDSLTLSKILDNRNESILSSIVEQEDSEQVKKMIQLFNLNHTKKQMIRNATYDQLLDHVMEQMKARITLRGDQFSNKDLIDYLNTMSNAMEKAQKQINDIDSVPTIQINQQNNIVNVGDTESLDRDSRKRVMDAVSSILDKIKNSGSIVSNQQEELVCIQDEQSSTELEDNLENNFEFIQLNEEEKEI